MKRKRMKYILCSLGVGICLTFGASVQAAMFTINTVDGDWINPLPNDGRATIVNSPTSGGLSTVRWGGQTEDSGYNFLSAAPPPFGVVSDGTLFKVGDFSHLNFEIPAGTAITGIDLDVNLVSLGNFNVDAVFNFDHLETDNAPGPPLSDDVVTITNPMVNVPFSSGGQNYLFNLLGFSQDGGTTISNVFFTAEGQVNLAGLYGNITEQPIPEPATMLLIGAGLAGLAGTRLRRKK